MEKSRNKKTGFAKNSRVWIHLKDAYNKVQQRKLIKKDELQDYLTQGWKLGSGTSGNRKNKSKDQRYIYCYISLNMSLPYISAEVYKTMTDDQKSMYIKTEKLLPKSELWSFLDNNPLWSQGRGNSYNSGEKNGMYKNGSTTPRGRDDIQRPPRPKKSKRMFNPNTTEKGRYVALDEIPEYEAKGWQLGMPLNRKKYHCPACGAEVSQGRKKNHRNSQSCRASQRHILLQKEHLVYLENGGSDAKCGNLRSYGHSNYYFSHPNRQKEERMAKTVLKIEHAYDFGDLT